VEIRHVERGRRPCSPLDIARAGVLAALESKLATAPTAPSYITACNALLAADSSGGPLDAALRLFRSLPPAVHPDSTTFVLALSACARLGDLSIGEFVKISASEAGYRNDIFVCSSLLVCAVKVFHGMPRRDRITWSTMVTGFDIVSTLTII
jgi:hypothetical protein